MDVTPNTCGICGFIWFQKIPTGCPVCKDNAGENVAFDLDGCIFYPIVEDFHDARHVQTFSVPDNGIVDRMKLMESLGATIYVVTGRSESLRFATLDALQRAGIDIPSRRILMQPKWAGMDALIEYKAQALLQLGAVLYVGDQQGDEKAAVMAGCRFLYTHQFRDQIIPAKEVQP